VRPFGQFEGFHSLGFAERDAAAPTTPDVPAGTVVEVSGIELEARRDAHHPRGQLAYLLGKKLRTKPGGVALPQMLGGKGAKKRATEQRKPQELWLGSLPIGCRDTPCNT